MSGALRVPAALAGQFLATIDALRGESAALEDAGLLTTAVDDLLDAALGTQDWLTELAGVVDVARGDARTEVVLPHREAWELLHVAYGISAVLVWAHELRLDGRLATPIPLDALAMWEVVEHRAGLGGRTSVALGVDVATLRGLARPGAAPEPLTAAVQEWRWPGTRRLRPVKVA